MRKTKLPAKEKAICHRLKEARLHLRLSQLEAARQIGIERTTLNNYESAATPLRFEVALTFCRVLIISEEWLAVGENGASRKYKSKARGWDLNNRMCMSLATEPVYHQVPRGALFSEAFDKYLQPVYTNLLAANAVPRVDIFAGDSHKILRNFLDWQIDYSLTQLNPHKSLRLLNTLIYDAMDSTKTIKEGYATEIERDRLVALAEAAGKIPEDVLRSPEKIAKWTDSAVRDYLASFDDPENEKKK